MNKSRLKRLEKALLVKSGGDIAIAVKERIEAALDYIYGETERLEPVEVDFDALDPLSRIIAEKIEAGLEKIYGGNDAGDDIGDQKAEV